MYGHQTSRFCIIFGLRLAVLFVLKIEVGIKTNLNQNTNKTLKS